MEEKQGASLIMQPGKGAGGKHRNASSSFILRPCAEPSDLSEREAISRCIALWAKLYRHNASERDTMNIHRRDLPVRRAFDW